MRDFLATLASDAKETVAEGYYNVAKECNGKHSPNEIANMLDMPLDDVEVLLYKLNKLDLIE